MEHLHPQTEKIQAEPASQDEYDEAFFANKTKEFRQILHHINQASKQLSYLEKELKKLF